MPNEAALWWARPRRVDDDAGSEFDYAGYGAAAAVGDAQQIVACGESGDADSDGVAVADVGCGAGNPVAGDVI